MRLWVVILIALVLSIEVFAYPGVLSKWINIDAYHIAKTGLLLVLFFSLKKADGKMVAFWNVCTRYVIPVLAVVLFVLWYLESNNYPNFVFNTFGVDMPSLLRVLVFLIFFAMTLWNNLGIKWWQYRVLAPLMLWFFYELVMFEPGWFIWVVQEDGVVEYLQFFLYLFGAYIFWKVFVGLKKIIGWEKLTVLSLLLCIGVGFVAFEEISWGQRLLGIETPEKLKEINHQNEITLHNIGFIQEYLLHFMYMMLGLFGAFSYNVTKKYLSSFYATWKLWLPPQYLFFCFFAVFAFYFAYDFYLFPQEIRVGDVPVVRWQEVFETFSAMGVYGYARHLYVNRKKLIVV
jgi:hypothetical protein